MSILSSENEQKQQYRENLRILRELIAITLEELRPSLPYGGANYCLTFIGRVEGNPDLDLIVTGEKEANSLHLALDHLFSGGQDVETVEVEIYNGELPEGVEI